MRVLILQNGADNGGVGIGIKRAFAKHAPDWEVHSVTRADNYIGFERDVYWSPGDPGHHVAELYQKADVVHVMDKLEAATDLSGYDERKPMVMHHHGSIFRARPEGFLAECRYRGIQGLVATFDLLQFAPGELEWMPHPVDVAAMRALRVAEHRRNVRIKVIHTPGAGDNGTDALKRAYNESSAPFDLEVVRGKPWAECMRLKARADALFDSFNIGYGMTSVEAFALGVPVVSGADGETERRVVDHLGFIPYLRSTPETIGGALETVVSDSTLRAGLAEQGMQAANDFHAEEKVVVRLKAVYERAVS